MPTVLIAEDDDDIRYVLHRILTRADFTVHTAVDGLAALELTVADPPDLVLTDLDMPGLDGFELCRAIRRDRRVRDLPVAILSGSLMPGDRRPISAGACRMLVKPIGNQDLVTEVRRLVESGRHRHGMEVPACPMAVPAG
jgi:CheY-like chemotaxis protein